MLQSRKKKCKAQLIVFSNLYTYYIHACIYIHIYIYTKCKHIFIYKYMLNQIAYLYKNIFIFETETIETKLYLQ